MKTACKQGVCFFLLLMFAVAAVAAGAQDRAVTGRVELFDPRTGRNEGNALGVVVWLLPASGASPVKRPASSSTVQGLRLVQKEKSFHPHLLAVEVGTSVEFPNQDPFFHNVFSLFEGKRFDLGLYEAGTSHTVHFDRAGICYIFCNIHPEMSAVVLVLNTPFFGMSDSAGNVTISAVPPGHYILRVWHERATPDDLRSLSREITVLEQVQSFGLVRIVETTALNLAHKNKYGQDYVRPSTANPGYPRP